MDDNLIILDTLTAISMALIFILILVNIARIRLTKIECIITFALFLITIKGIDFASVSLGIRSAITHGSIIFFTALMLKRKIQNIPLSIFYAVLMSIISLLTGQISGGIVIAFISRLPNSWAITHLLASNAWSLSFFYIGIFFLLTLTTSKLIGLFLYKQLGNIHTLLKGKFVSYLMIGAILTISLFLAVVILDDILYNLALQEMVYGLSMVLCFSYFVFSLYTFSKNMQIEIESKHLQIYTENIEVMNKELRIFRHDHFNILLGFSEYIKNCDLSGMEQYYNSYMKTLHTKTGVEAFDLDFHNLINIKIYSVKAILSYKLQYAHLSGINVNIISIGEVSSISKNISLIDLCRIIGILLDNAVEACIEHNKNERQAVLEFATTDYDKYVSFQFANTFHTLPPLHKMFEEGYTTKPDGQGLGLYYVSKIVDENDGLNLESHIDDNGLYKYLIHELNVAK